MDNAWQLIFALPALIFMVILIMWAVRAKYGMFHEMRETAFSRKFDKAALISGVGFVIWFIAYELFQSYNP